MLRFRFRHNASKAWVEEGKMTIRLEKYSQLANIITNIKNDRVPTSAFHRRNCMEELTPEMDMPVGKERPTWYMFLDDAKQNKDNMYIGGYGFGKEDTGADCPITEAVYSLHMFATKCNADVGSYFRLGKMHLTRKSENIERLTGFVLNGSLDVPLMQHPHGNVEFVAAPIVTSKNVPLYAMGLLANVERHGLKYTGDITLRLDTEIGRGKDFIDRERSAISHKPYESKIYGEMLRTESLKTKDIVFSRSLLGSSFRNAIMDRIGSMKYIAGQSGINYDSIGFMLRVENLYPMENYNRN